MRSFEFSLLSVRARLAGAVVAALASAFTLVCVLGIFASASGELKPVLAKLQPAAAVASAVAAKVRKAARG